jgi:hypothetical protein
MISESNAILKNAIVSVDMRGMVLLRAIDFEL